MTLAGTGLSDEGEWTDEVRAARATGGSGSGERQPAYVGRTAAGPGAARAGAEAVRRCAGRISPGGAGRGGQARAGKRVTRRTGLADEGECTDEVAAAERRASPRPSTRPRARPGAPRPARAWRRPDRPGCQGGDGTLLPFYLDPMTKLFLVALIWCRPWLDDPSATRPLPRTPEIARGALEVTGAYHELERFDADPEYRDLLSARVAEHIKVLRRKIADRGLAAADVRLSDEVAVRILIEHGIITSADLSRLDDPAWRSRQEDLWWTQS